MNDEPKPLLTMQVRVSMQTRSATYSGPFPYQEHPEDKTIDYGIDANGPCGRTWWRIVERGEQTLYLSTFIYTGVKVLATEDGHHVCRPGQVLQLENDITPAAEIKASIKKERTTK